MKISPADPEILPLRATKSCTTQNWLSWQLPLRNRKNWTGLTTVTLIPSIWCKNRKNRSTEIALLKLKKKETGEGKIYSLVELADRAGRVGQLKCH